jgi:asparagine synthase (glutamine-hydrolysing)
VNEEVRGAEEVDNIPAGPEAAQPIADSQAPAQGTERSGVTRPGKHEYRLRRVRSHPRECPDETLLVLDPVRTADGGEHGPAVKPELPANRISVCLGGVEPVELEAMMRHDYLLPRHPVHPDQRVTHLGRRSDDGIAQRTGTEAVHGGEPAAVLQRDLVRVVGGEDGNGSASEPGRRQAHETAVKKVCLDHVDPLPAETPGKLDDRSGVVGATVRSESECRESHPPGVLLKSAGRADRPKLNIEAGAVGVVADQLEVRMRSGAADEMEDAHSATGEIAARSHTARLDCARHVQEPAADGSRLMCGICGLVADEPGDVRPIVEAQLDSLHHRGPDAHGSFTADRAVISQNRLAIIDLETGDPPITNEDGSVAVVLNGEIYNFQALQDQLQRQGHRLRSRGDTEVIAHLAEELPPAELARRLDGMFAFAVWDERRGRLVIGRDRLGKKPLFYWSSGGRLAFGSEIKALLAEPSVPRRLDEGAISAYLTFGYVPTPRTFFDGIHSLPPGHVLTFEPGGEPAIERYWDPPLTRSADGMLNISLADAAREVRALLRQAVRRRLVSDVPLGAFLSGGIDSTTVVGLMAELIDRPVQTFTIGFEDREGFDERPYARRAANRHRTDHHEYVVRPDAVDLVERLVWHHDQPFGDSSAVPTFLLGEVTRRNVTVALSGDGGDELFAGYERFAGGVAARQYAAMPAPLQRAVGSAIELLPDRALRGRASKARRFTQAAEAGLPDAFRSWISFIQDSDSERLLDGARDEWGLKQYQAIWRASEGGQPLDRLLDLNLRTYLLDDLLVKADRMSMAHGLEVRSPFLDVDLLAFTTRLPPRLKARGLALKRVLKAAVKDLVPAEILRRPKKGFGVPLDRWFREDLRNYVGSTLGTPDARVKAHLVPDAVDRLIAEHDSCARDHGHALWTLLTLEVFLRRQNW